jgi:hypothetical protein
VERKHTRNYLVANKGSSGVEAAPKGINWLLVVAIFIGGLAAAYYLGTRNATCEEAITRISAILQLAGLCVVAKGIRDLRKEVGDRKFRTEFGQDVRYLAVRGREQLVALAAFFRKPKQSHPVIVATSTARLNVSASGHITITAQQTVEQRVQALERRLGEAEGRTAELARRIQEEGEQRTAAIRTVSENLHRRYEELWQKVRNIAAGGIRLEILGLLWLLIGTLLPALPTSLLCP